jgi:hypothetical protein
VRAMATGQPECNARRRDVSACGLASKRRGEGELARELARACRGGRFAGGEGDFLDREGRQVLGGALELLGRLLLAKRMVIFEQVPLVALANDAAEQVPQPWLAYIPKRVLVEGD